MRPGTTAEVAALSQMLARAFVSDPVASYVFPAPNVRHDQLRRFFALQLRRSYLPRGQVWVSDGLEGAALWLPPDLGAPRISDALWPLLLAASLGARLRTARRLGRLLAERHPVYPHWYLGTIGVEPIYQGHGIGSALLGPVLDVCDARRTGAYVECSRLENVAFYTRHGFALTEQIVAPGGPPLWLMWRQPQLRS